MLKNLSCMVVLIGALALFGCGGGGGGGAAPVSPTKAELSFVLVNRAQLPCPISGVEVNGLVPAGLTVTTGTSPNARKPIVGLAAGSALASAGSQAAVYGSYSSPNSVHVIIASGGSANSGFGAGEIFKLTCGLLPGTTALSPEDVANLKASVSLKASGINPDTHVLVPLESYLDWDYQINYLP